MQGNVEAGLIEQTNFFVTFIIAILTGARTVHLFRACGHCCLLRKLATRLLAIVNGGFAMEQIYRAVSVDVSCKGLLLGFGGGGWSGEEGSSSHTSSITHNMDHGNPHRRVSLYHSHVLCRYNVK